MDLDAALEYSERHGLHALLVARDGAVVMEEYVPPYDADKAHALYSGTKSFWGPCALAAQHEGILSLDEPVAATVPTWDEPGRRRVTLRMLLQLTAGIGFGGLGSSVPTYEKALETPLRSTPGTTFTYGGIPLQIFGAVLAQKLAPKTAHEYLQERILDPAGVEVAQWRSLSDGTHPLPTGAFLTARNWMKYGEWILAHRSEYADCFVASSANARYGLGWWLLGDDVFYASGSGGQALYVLPAHNVVAVHFGQSRSWRHETFVRRLAAG